MPDSNQADQKKDIASWKPGSEAAAAKDVKAEGDFGVPVGSGTSRQREYVSGNTKASDPGAALPRSGEEDGVRDSGAGAIDSGPGSGSGGDLDPDVIGFGGAGGGIAATGTEDAAGPDEATGTSDDFASGRHARGENQTGVHKVGGDKRVRGGSTVGGADVYSGADDAQGADAATNPAARGDDSFAAEISTGEAQGDDLGLSPSSDDQGSSTEDNQAYQKDESDAG